MSFSSYNHQQVELKWTQKWQETNIYKTPELKKGDLKKYILETFPYPSADGLHAGHPVGYTASDITARFARANNYKVLYPMGWDAFGLPTENFAKKNNRHPQEVTSNSIKNFTNQVKRLGASYDWEKEINTSDPNYYKWTQWLFQLLYKRGLAYKKKALVNWDPVDKTVLANEQILPNGTAERSQAVVEQKMMSQWFFKITDYAERLLNDLDTLDWPESTKQMQKNWIGKSEGAEIDFKIEDSDQKISVFTTAHDTIFGVTFLVISPEHAFVDILTTDNNKEIVKKYIQTAKTKSNLQRTDLNKDKTGVFSGSYSINPINGAKIPIWIADYVLTTYGTGAVMAVPGEDERDYEFANKYDLPVIYTNHTNQFVSYSQEIKNNKEKYTLINSSEFDGLNFKVGKDKILQKIVENKYGKATVNYRLRDWSIGRQRYWGCPIPVVYDKSGKEMLIPESDLPLILPEDLDLSTGQIKPLSQNQEFIDSASSKYGKGFNYEGDTMDSFVCSSWYFFRYCSKNIDNIFADFEDIKKWMPVDQYIIGAEHSTLHLLYARFFTKVLFDEKLIDFDEPFLKVRHQGLLLGDDNNKMSKSKGNVVNPDDIFDKYGADTLRMYLMFMGPFNQPKPWNTDSIKGVRRFIERVWNLQERVYFGPNQFKNFEELQAWGYVCGPKTENIIEKALHRLTKKIGDDIESYSFNTCISEFMKFINLVEDTGAITVSQLQNFLILLAPFAPFVTEEIWEKLSPKIRQSDIELGRTVIQIKPISSIHVQSWPNYSREMLIDSEVKIVVQINGKVRTDFEIDTNTPESKAIEQATKLAEKWIDGKTIKFTKYIPNKLVTIVTD